MRIDFGDRLFFGDWKAGFGLLLFHGGDREAGIDFFPGIGGEESGSSW